MTVHVSNCSGGTKGVSPIPYMYDCTRRAYTAHSCKRHLVKVVIVSIGSGRNVQYSIIHHNSIWIKSKSSQISFIAWKIRKIGEASADTAATEAHYMKGYYNLEEETIKVKI